jgi:hypothetical protein
MRLEADHCGTGFQIRTFLHKKKSFAESAERVLKDTARVSITANASPHGYLIEGLDSSHENAGTFNGGE